MSKIETGKSQVAAAILAQLKDPFNPDLVKYTRLGGNKLVAYVDARDVMKRLDTIMGMENWQDKYIRTDGGFICELSLRIEGQWITKSNGSNDTKIQPHKGGISGAFKRAAVNWGIGRYLYYFDPELWRSDNKEAWPKIFKPGAPEDWEDVAELKYGLLDGMDEEGGSTLEEKINSFATEQEIKEFLNNLTPEEKRQATPLVNVRLKEFEK
jgi:hypothetical protein